jgi:hypothetical protein
LKQQKLVQSLIETLRLAFPNISHTVSLLKSLRIWPLNFWSGYTGRFD